MTYCEFIQNILNTRGRFSCGDEYHERHHVIPKCLGGNNNEDNLIDLYAKEHYEAHKLLALENPNNYKLQYAWISMGFLKSATTKERYLITADEYEILKKLSSKLASIRMTGEGNPMYGKTLSEETKRKIGEKSKGRHFSDEVREKMSAHAKGKQRPEDVRRKISDGNKGKVFSKQHRENISKSRKEKRIGCISVCQYDKNGVLIKIWDSATSAGIELNIAPTNITRCCRGRGLKSAGGFVWRYNKEGE